MELLKLNKQHQPAFESLNQVTLNSLTDPTYFIPFTGKEIENSFTGSPEVILYGAFDNGNLAAVSGLFAEVSDLFSVLELPFNQEKTIEIGGCMTLPEFRGKGCMLMLNKELVKIAVQHGFNSLVATAHPDNIASNKSLQKLGMKKIREFYRHGEYLRNLYFMEL